MTGPEDRRRGLDRAMQELEALLAKRISGDDDDPDDLDDLPVYQKDD